MMFDPGDNAFLSLSDEADTEVNNAGDGGCGLGQ